MIGQTRLEGMKSQPDPHYRHRFPAEIIGHPVWLYRVFSLSLRDVKLLLAERDIVVSYETVRRWCQKFGESFADRLRRRRPRATSGTSTRYLSGIQGVQHSLWRAVDEDGVVLDILDQERRNGNAAKRFFKRLVQGLQYVPRVIITDKLRSYGVAQRRLLPTVERRQSRLLQVHLSALMTTRVAADVLQHLLPIDAGRSPETLRHHTLRIGEQLGTATSDRSTTPATAAAITVSVDWTFIRSREEGERHLEVRVGNVETASGGRQVFGAVAKAVTDISALIQQSRRPNRRH